MREGPHIHTKHKDNLNFDFDKKRGKWKKRNYLTNNRVKKAKKDSVMFARFVIESIFYRYSWNRNNYTNRN